MKNLRTFLEKVRCERPRDIIDVHRTVNPKFETTAILTKLEQAWRFPVLFFHSVEKSQFPVATNVCGSAMRLALAMECPVSELAAEYADRISNPIKPAYAAYAPVQERVFEQSRLDLGMFPQFVYHENDTREPYITGAIVVARDPDTGKSNLSYHRLMITTKSSTSIFIAQHSHLDRIYSKYAGSGEAMPIAAFIGAHPVWSLGAVYGGPVECEEYDIIGGLLRAPLEVTGCVTNTLCVPAEAEFALEGFVLPRERVPEGPFGEFTGYSTGMSDCPRFMVKAITSRADPIYQDIVSGGTEHKILPVLDMEHRLLCAARAVAQNTVQVRVPLPLTAFVSLGKHDASEPGRIMAALAESSIYVKQIVVVDADVDIADLRQVSTAIALHVRPERDIHILSGIRGTELDPASESHDGITAKLGIDATRVQGSRPLARNTVPKHILDSIDLSDFLAPGLNVGARR